VCDIEVGSGLSACLGLLPSVSRQSEERRLKSRRQDEILTPHRQPALRTTYARILSALLANRIGIHFHVAHPSDFYGLTD
jgi:hypothetical protein